MKKFLQRPFVKKILLFIIGCIIILLVFDNIIFPWYVSSSEVVVPNLRGMKESEAFSLLENNKLEPVIADTTYDIRFSKGTVIIQKPHAGEKVKEGRRVYLFISGGEPVVSVPLLKGKSLKDAKFSLERLGLKLGQIDEVSSSHPKDMIVDQQYAEGTPIKKGEQVGISISIGAGTGSIVVPDLIGKSLAEAERVLADSSLKVGRINYQRSFSLLPNTILDQYPSKGNKANAGDAVDLFVTKAAEPGEETREE
jgi:beta-lactam-binding protein with PASTA domain